MREAYTEIKSCEVCGNGGLCSVLDLGQHPMCDDLVPLEDNRQCKTYPIEILFCETCWTAHQRFQLPKGELFPPTYHYRAAQTVDVLTGMRQLVDACRREFGQLYSKTVLDIGCNDGSLLSIFRNEGATTFGIEPTDAAKDALRHGHIVVQAFLTEVVASEFVRAYGQPDFITFTNVFAHIEDLHGLICALKILKSQDTVLIVENHYLGAIIEKNQFDTFYHEHPRTYSYRSFTFIAESLGMRISKVDFPQRYGGNIRVFMTHHHPGTSLIHDRRAEIENHERTYGSDLEKLAFQIGAWRVNKRVTIEEEFRRAGKLRAKAFPGRAAIPIKLLGLDEEMIQAVHEKPGSPKIGHFVPGTRIPILSDDDLMYASVEGPVINLAWHIHREIDDYLRKKGYKNRIIDIISESDFSRNP